MIMQRQTYWRLALSPRRRSQYIRGATHMGDGRYPRELCPAEEGHCQCVARPSGCDNSHRLQGISALLEFCHKRPSSWTSLRSPYHRELRWFQGHRIVWKEPCWYNTMYEISVHLTVYTPALPPRRQQDRRNERPQVMQLGGRGCLPWAQWGGEECLDQDTLRRCNDI